MPLARKMLSNQNVPELPEVETVANGLNERVGGDTILSVWLGGKPEPLKSPPEEIEKTLKSKKIEKVHRIGKTVVFELAGGAQFLVHLGMTGRLLVNAPDVPMVSHTHAVLHLKSGKEVRFVDPRRFGRVSVTQGYTGPGAEPLKIAPEAFISLFKARKTPIKSALLNQKLLHGVGNIYADESLHRAGIRPTKQAGRLTHAELLRLHKSLKTVLEHAIKLGGSSVSDYVDADGVRGFFQLEHRVYMRTNEPCKSCKTPIKRTTLAGRGTHYCPTCQR